MEKSLVDIKRRDKRNFPFSWNIHTLLTTPTRRLDTLTSVPEVLKVGSCRTVYLVCVVQSHVVLFRHPIPSPSSTTTSQGRAGDDPPCMARQAPSRLRYIRTLTDAPRTPHMSLATNQIWGLLELFSSFLFFLLLLAPQDRSWLLASPPNRANLCPTSDFGQFLASTPFISSSGSTLAVQEDKRPFSDVAYPQTMSSSPTQLHTHIHWQVEPQPRTHRSDRASTTLGSSENQAKGRESRIPSECIYGIKRTRLRSMSPYQRRRF
ncbi:hypothetical protein B0H66DRAFT_28545 [Apodospora peruviana]|uniref:Uncharacterized protein n=1 Tax=Apodospora peruviana TaxID=516989 RepID=A0AAE0MFW4_9PEZI|nr:hypothetical protein B0H66DRAFT_28545 [Apodospora peruviana]